MTTTFDLNAYPAMHPAASLALGSLEFGRTRLKALLEDLSAEQLAEKPGNFANDIATLVVHLGAVEIRFSHLILGKEPPEELVAMFLLDRPQSPLPRATGETPASLMEKLDLSLEYVREALQSLSDEDLGRVISARPGVRFSVRWMIGLLPAHLTQHLGQIQMLIKHLRGT